MPALSAKTPPGESWMVRELARIRREALETIAAVAGSITRQVAFLLGQSVSAEAVPGAVTQVTTNPATSNVSDTWVAFDAAADASVTVTTSSTGRLAVQAGGYVWLSVTNGCSATGFIGVEILDAGSVQVRAPLNGDGNLSSISGASNTALNVAAGHRHEWALTPNTTYTLRCRRGYSVGAGSAGAVASTAFQGTGISVTKLGI